MLGIFGFLFVVVVAVIAVVCVVDSYRVTSREVDEQERRLQRDFGRGRP